MAAIFRDDVEYYFAGPASYNHVIDHPTISGIEVVGNKTRADYGIANAADIGNLSSLETTEKSTLVGAINELCTMLVGIDEALGAI